MDPRKFEKKFEQPSIDLVQSPRLVKSYPKYRLRTVLSLLVGLTLVVASLILLRGYFLQNPPNFDNENLFTSIYKTFYPITSSKKIKEEERITESITNLDAVKSPFTKPYSEGRIWLALKNDRNTFVGYLDAFDRFNFIYRLPLNAADYKLYNNEYLSYLINTDKIGQKSTLYFLNLHSDILFSYELEEGEQFINHYYDPTVESFYFTMLDNNGIFYLKLIGLDSKVFELYESTYFSNKARIEYADSEKYLVYLQDGNSCHILNIKQKNLIEIGCEYVKRNDEGELFYSNESSDNNYTSYIAGEIYTTLQNNQLEEVIVNHLRNGLTTRLKPADEFRRVLFTGTKGEIYSKLAYFNGSVWFFRNTLVQKNASSWQGQILSIEKISTKPAQIVKEKVTDKLPAGTIYELIPTDKSLYAITESDFVGQTRLFKFYQNGIHLYEPISYPSSFPTSYSPSTPPIVYWKEVNLNLAGLEGVELVGAKWEPF